MGLLPTNDTLGILRKSAENMRCKLESEIVPKGTEYNTLEIFRKAAENMRCKPEGEIVPKGTEYIDHSMFLGNEADMRLHMEKLREYLMNNPGDMETRISLANLERMFKS